MEPPTSIRGSGVGIDAGVCVIGKLPLGVPISPTLSPQTQSNSNPDPGLRPEPWLPRAFVTLAAFKGCGNRSNGSIRISGGLTPRMAKSGRGEDRTLRFPPGFQPALHPWFMDASTPECTGMSRRAAKPRNAWEDRYIQPDAGELLQPLSRQHVALI